MWEGGREGGREERGKKSEIAVHKDTAHVARLFEVHRFIGHAHNNIDCNTITVAIMYMYIHVYCPLTKVVYMYTSYRAVPVVTQSCEQM